MKLIEYVRPQLYKKQEEAIFHKERYGLIEASTKSGKTTGCIIWLFEQALQGESNKNYWWIAPVFPQADIAFRRLCNYIPRELYKKHEQKMTITLLNGAVIWFKSADNPDSLYGEDVYAAVIDEASRCKKEAWHAIRSTTTATKAYMRLIGNVKGRKNFFYELCRRAESGEPNMHYAVIDAYDAIEAGILDAAEIEDAKRILPEAVFNELYLCNPSDDGGNPFGFKYIRNCIKPMSENSPYCWGIDLAKSNDWCVAIALDKNGDTCRFDRWQGPWKATIERIKKLVGNTPALVDSTGVGDPIVEELQQGTYGNYIGYKFTAPSKQKLMEGLVMAIQQETVSYPQGVIVSELEAFEYEYTRTGVKYSAPEGMHDDCVCALALARNQFTDPVAGAGFLEYYKETFGNL